MKIVISGAGIAGLTLGTLLKEQGHDVVVVERDASLRLEGYMMDFFGTGWDVAERMGLVDALHEIHYPIDAMDYVDAQGHTYLHLPIARVKDALKGKYTYLRRPDLERIVSERSQQSGVTIRFSTTISAIEEKATEVLVAFEPGNTESFDLVIGADGVHSRVRELVFGPEKQFDRFLGYYVAAFHIPKHDYAIGRALKLYEEVDRLAGFYPISESVMDATYIFRHENAGFVPRSERLPLVRKKFKGAGWIAETVLLDYVSTEPIFFDSVTQITMNSWSKGRVALIGDACGCLTLLAGQGSHMAMAGAYVLANELQKNNGDYKTAFHSYETFLKPAVQKKQQEAARLSKRFVPSSRSITPLRHLVMKGMFSPLLIKYSFTLFGGKSILAHYR